MDNALIAYLIKPISKENIKREIYQLIKIGDALKAGSAPPSPRTRLGNNIVDYFTFTQRLATRGKYNINFFEFVERIDEFKKKHYIQTMVNYYTNVKNKNGKKNKYVVLKEIYNICISAINIMRPLFCMELFTRYNPKTVLNCCAGWGGSLVAASALNINYIGIEINGELKEPYSRLLSFLQEEIPSTNAKVFFEDATTFDYSKIEYDMVFTSPPYYFIEKYENNLAYLTKCDMDTRFYTPLFQKVYSGLSPNGIFAINVCKEIYDRVLNPLLGEATELVPYKKSKRQNEYTEMVYVWRKIAASKIQHIK